MRLTDVENHSVHCQLYIPIGWYVVIWKQIRVADPDPHSISIRKWQQPCMQTWRDGWSCWKQRRQWQSEIYFDVFIKIGVFFAYFRRSLSIEFFSKTWCSQNSALLEPTKPQVWKFPFKKREKNIQIYLPDTSLPTVTNQYGHQFQ